jgi:predicted dehydrogenase
MLSVAGIGLGDLGRFELSVLADREDVELVGGADPSPDARTAFAREQSAPTYEDYEELLAAESPDAVTIATPHTLHYDQASAAMAAGAHVHVEKPMVTDLADARDLIATAERAGLTLAVGYQRHFDPRFREIRRLLDAGRIGRLHMAACHLEQRWIEWTRDQWRSDPALSGGGQLYDSGSHLLDALLWTTRATPTSVAAAVDRAAHEVDVDSALAATLDRGGDTVTASVGVTGDGASSPAPGESLRLFGTDGAVEFDGDRLRVTEDGVTYAAEVPEPEFETVTRRKLDNFVEAVRGEAGLEIPARDALKVTALTEAAYEAADSGRRVDVDLDSSRDGGSPAGGSSEPSGGSTPDGS